MFVMNLKIHTRITYANHKQHFGNKQTSDVTLVHDFGSCTRLILCPVNIEPWVAEPTLYSRRLTAARIPTEDF